MRSRRRRHRGGGEWSGGVSLSSRLGCLVERCKLPQQRPGQSPGQNRLVHFNLERTHLTTSYLVFSDITCTENDWKNWDIGIRDRQQSEKSAQYVFFLACSYSILQYRVTKTAKSTVRSSVLLQCKTRITHVHQTQKKLLRHKSLPVYFRASARSHAELPILVSCNCCNIDGISNSMDYR